MSNILNIKDIINTFDFLYVQMLFPQKPFESQIDLMLVLIPFFAENYLFSVILKIY